VAQRRWSLRTARPSMLDRILVVASSDRAPTTRRRRDGVIPLCLSDGCSSRRDSTGSRARTAPAVGRDCLRALSAVESTTLVCVQGAPTYA